jgi:hypothetical protein
MDIFTELWGMSSTTLHQEEDTPGHLYISISPTIRRSSTDANNDTFHWTSAEPLYTQGCPPIRILVAPAMAPLEIRHDKVFYWAQHGGSVVRIEGLCGISVDHIKLRCSDGTTLWVKHRWYGGELSHGWRIWKKILCLWHASVKWMFTPIENGELIK